MIRTGPAPNGRKVVYLTFDDGPTRFTPQVLDVLRGYNAKATFFVIGGQVRTREATVRRARAEGHLVQNHTWNHPLLTPLRYAQVTRQLVLTNRAIRAAGLPQPACMRPPYGAFDTTVRQASRATGQRVVNWSLDSRDWTKPGARSIAGRVVGTVRPGSIVLLHDGGGDRSQTVAALRVILRTLGRQGYSFATLPVCR